MDLQRSASSASLSQTAKRSEVAQAVEQAKSGQLKEAILALSEITRTNRSDVTAWFELGNAYMCARDEEQAIRAFEQAMSLDRLDLDIKNNLAVAFYVRGRLDHARRLLEEVTQQRQDPLAFSNLGLVFVELEDLDKAEVAYRTALQRDPGCMFALVNLGDLLVRKKALDAAVEVYSKAVQVDKHDIDARLALGQTQLKTGQLISAATQFRTICEQNPHHERAIQLLAEAVERQGYATDAAAIRRGVQAGQQASQASLTESKLSELQNGSERVRRDSDAASEMSVATISSTATSKSKRRGKLFGF